jgi:cobalt-zinc-cadmium efflux system protein
MSTGLPPHALTERAGPLRTALVITIVMMLVEVVGGLISGSLALLADAGHMFADVAALGLSLFAFWLSGRPRSERRTFGWRRFEIFAAFVNGLALWAVAFVIGYEAVKRLGAPPAVKSGLMTAVAAVGLAANLAAGAVLLRGRERSLNVRGAFLHVVADAAGSAGVLVAALLIGITGSYAWDPAVSLAVCLLILWGSTRLVRESFLVFMEGAPRHLDVSGVEKTLAGVPGVLGIHDLHVWTITSDFVSLSAHLKVRKGESSEDVLRRAQDAVSSGFGVLHTTFQLEFAETPGCETGSCDEIPPAHKEQKE